MKKSNRGSGAKRTAPRHLAKSERAKTDDPVDCLCWLADWLIEMLESHRGHLAESPAFPGSTLNCFAVKLGLTTNEPSQWPYHPDNWSEYHLRDREFRESLIERFEELKEKARAHGSWEDRTLQSTAADEDLDRLKHCAYAIADEIGTTPPNHVHAGPKSRAFVEGLVRAGLLDRDWILLMRTGVLNFPLTRLRNEPGRFPALAAIIERVLFPKGQVEPPIGKDLLGNLLIGDKSWVESMIEKIRMVQADKEKLGSANIEEYIPLKEIPPESCSEKMTLSQIAKQMNVTPRYLHTLMRSRSVRVAKHSRQRYVYDQDSPLAKQIRGKSQKNLSLPK